MLSRLDTTANRYLGGWKVRFGDGAECGAALRQLLDHTSGATAAIPTFYEHAGAVPDIETSLEMERVVAEAKPGERFLYSNGGYAVLQAVVERVTSAAFASVMHELVLSPLGMSSSSFDWSDVQDDVHRPHRRAGQPMAPQFSAGRRPAVSTAPRPTSAASSTC